MANPPITIGPFNNVPAPGSPIRSDWTQHISQWVWDRIRSKIGSVDDLSGNLHILVLADEWTGVPDANGLVAVPFAQAFAAAPIVVASNGQYPGAGVIVGTPTITAADFTLAFYNAAGPLGGAQSATWVAVGYRA